MGPAVVILAAQLHLLTLADAVSAAVANQPTLRQGRAATEAAQARVDEARAPILPQLVGTGIYQRTTGNFVARPGAIPSTTTTSTAPAPAATSTYNFYNFGLTLSQFIWDFGQTTDKWRAAKESAVAQEKTERATKLQVVLGARTAYFAARAQKSLVEVAKETLDNQGRHLAQVREFVEVGARPEIDLAQAETDYANTEVQLISAQNGYETAKVQLNQAMGVDAPPDFDVEVSELPPAPGEDDESDALVAEAVHSRPELASLERQIRAQELLVSSAKGAYGPTLGASTSVTDAGTDLSNLTWNWNVQASATWPLFSGLLTMSQVKEAHANLVSLEAQRDTVKQQVRVDVDQARLSVRAGKATVVAADKALTNARVRLRLAEERYSAGVGNAVELGDAQVAVTSAGAQKVQAEFNLATARALLLRALGRTT